MDIVNGKTYRFINVYHDGYGLNIYGTKDTDIKGGQNVCLYSASPTDQMQQWKAVAVSGASDVFQLEAVLNSIYVLDCSDGSISTSYKNNAHMCKKTGTSAVDSGIIAEPVQGNQVRICLPEKNLYLTATTVAENDAELSNNISTSAALRGGSTGRGNVYWASPASEGSMTWKKQCWEVIEVGGGTDPEPEPGEYDKNYLIYPTTVMNLTQNYNDGNHYYCSHETPADYPIDEASEGPGRSWFYCPCDKMKIMHITKTGTCTIWMESLTPVVTPSGTYDTITIMVMHPNRSEVIDLEGQTFYRGDKMFLEGTSGTKDPHFHMSVGTGHYQGNGTLGWSGPKSDGVQWSMTPTGKTMKPEDMFFVDSSFTQIKNTRNLNFTKIN